MTDVVATLSDWLFRGWGSIGRILVVGLLAYAGLLLFLRVSGKRTLSKMNARFGGPIRFNHHGFTRFNPVLSYRGRPAWPRG